MDPIAQPPEPTAAAPAPEAEPRSRRSFLRVGVITAGAVAALALGVQRLRTSGSAVAQRVIRALPSPSATLPPLPTDPAASTEGLTPLVTANADFFRIDVAFTVPSIDAGTWSLTVDGDVATPLTLDYDSLAAMGLVEVDATLMCVSNPIGGHEIGTARWTGVRLADVLARCAPGSGVEQVYCYGGDGFTAGFPLAAGLQRDALIAIGMNGEPLPQEHGYPARLVVPGQYGYVSAVKWLTRVELTTWGKRAGYWLPRGWSRLGPVKTASRIDVPAQGANVRAGTVTVAGMAWCAPGAPSRVQVRHGDGPWIEATLGPVVSDYTWRQWWCDVQLATGRATLEVRAYDAAGQVQTEKVAAVAPDGATGWHSVVVDVA